MTKETNDILNLIESLIEENKKELEKEDIILKGTIENKIKYLEWILNTISTKYPRDKTKGE